MVVNSVPLQRFVKALAENPAKFKSICTAGESPVVRGLLERYPQLQTGERVLLGTSKSGRQAYAQFDPATRTLTREAYMPGEENWYRRLINKSERVDMGDPTSNKANYMMSYKTTIQQPGLQDRKILYSTEVWDSGAGIKNPWERIRQLVNCPKRYFMSRIDPRGSAFKVFHQGRSGTFYPYSYAKAEFFPSDLRKPSIVEEFCTGDKYDRCVKWQ